MSPTVESQSPLARIGIALILVVLAVTVYWPVRCGEFVSDDHRFIVDNVAQLTRDDAPGAFFTEPTTVATPPDPDIWRPLRTTSFALDLHVFGPDPCGFHAVNVGLHALVVLLLCAWLTALVGAGPAACGAALFCVHPLATEAVAWISSRADLLVAVAILAALLVARRAERTGRGGFGLVLIAVVAGLSKESGVMLPALYVLDVRMRTGRWLPRASRRPLVALCVGSAIYLAGYLTWFRPGIQPQVAWYGGSFATHLPYALLGLGTLLRLVVWPVDPNFLWDASLFHPAEPAIVRGAVIAATVVGVLVVVARRRNPFVLTGLAWFFVALLPAANLLLPMRTVLAERFAYVPLFGLAAAFAGALRNRTPTRRLAWTLAVVAVLAPLTWMRAAEFASPRALYEATLRSWPRSTSAWMGLASLDLEAGAYDSAATRFDRAADVALPDVRQSWRCRIAAATARLQAGQADDAAAGLEAFVRAVDASAPLATVCADLIPEALFRLGQALGLAGRYGEAADRFEELVQRFPPRPDWFDAWGELERVRGDTRLAIEKFTLALDLDAEFHAARLHRALLLAEFPALRAQALGELRELLARDPTNARAREAIEALTH